VGTFQSDTFTFVELLIVFFCAVVADFMIRMVVVDHNMVIIGSGAIAVDSDIVVIDVVFRLLVDALVESNELKQ